MAKVVAWVEGLAPRYEIPVQVQHAIHLCLEEALTNVIVHGYHSEPDHSIDVELTAPRTGFVVFVVNDEAPPFNPLAVGELPSLNPDDPMRIGGQGIRFLRRFADSLGYETTPAGNRLTIGFSVSGRATPA
jgi:anti-sigma regulatory factor (Ser/Thr protein kinase)